MIKISHQIHWLLKSQIFIILLVGGRVVEDVVASSTSTGAAEDLIESALSSLSLLLQTNERSDAVEFMKDLATVGATALPHNDMMMMTSSSSSRTRGLKGSSSSDDDECKKGTDLNEFQQWNDEVGYWIGDYTLLTGDGTYNVADTWPYPYDSYTGFITGNIEGKAYRQRNVFFYPPQTSERCEEISGTTNPSVIGTGTCGTNGNSLVFSADQAGCESKDGSLTGSLFNGLVSTTTELVGADNSLLYQVYFNGNLTQSQLTTITMNGNSRTRTAQNFNVADGSPSGTSYYRERKVTREEFYIQLNETIANYNILSDDLCLRDGFLGRQPRPGYIAGYNQCLMHLEQSFEL